MAKVSVIVPAYNAEKTLARCLSGLVNQTLQDIEIILVNDCSTDATFEIMTECEKQFPQKLMVINLSENLGAGGARNVALQYASGEYIGFVDSDDEVVTTMYEKLYNEAVAGDYDIVDGGYFNEFTDNAMVHTADELTGILDDVKRNELIASGGYFWSRIFKKSLLDRVELHFREHCILEDCETLMYLIANAKSIGNVKEILYCYHYYATSASKHNDEESYYRNVTSAIEAVYKTMSPLANYDGIKEAVEYVIVNFCALIVSAYTPQITALGGIAAIMRLLPSSPLSASISPIKSKLSRISDYLRTMTTIPLSQNHFVQNKIPRDTLSRLTELSRCK